MEIIEKFVSDIPNPYGYIYITTNLKNGMRYVGKHRSTEFDPTYYGSGVMLKKAIQSEGLGSFKCEPIEWVSSDEELTSRELFWIKELKAVESDQWYNLIAEYKPYSKGEPPYIKVYLDHLNYLSDIPKTCSKVLMALLKHISYADDTDGGMIVQPTGWTRKRIMSKLGYTNSQSLTNALTQLVKGKVLFKLTGGAYRLNPYLFGKGEWTAVERLRTTITYDLKGRTFQTEVSVHKDPPSNTIVRKPIILLGLRDK